MSATAKAFDEIAARFAVELHEAGLALDPGNLAILDGLAHAYTAAGEYERGLEIDRKLAEALPHDPTIRYNLACSLSLAGRVDECIDVLLKAVDLGYRDLKHMLADNDLVAARAHARFEEVRNSLTSKRKA